MAEDESKIVPLWDHMSPQQLGAVLARDHQRKTRALSEIIDVDLAFTIEHEEQCDLARQTAWKIRVEHVRDIQEDGAELPRVTAMDTSHLTLQGMCETLEQLLGPHSPASRTQIYFAAGLIIARFGEIDDFFS